MEKPWLKHYPAGSKSEIDFSEVKNVAEMFRESCELYGDETAFINMGSSISFKQFDDQAKLFASFLQNDLKLKKGDRVALMMPNILQYPIALFGIIRAGMIVVNVNPMYTPRELEHQLNDSGAVAVVAVTNFGLSLQKAVGSTSVKHVILTSIGDQFNAPKRALINFVVKYVKKSVPKYHLPGAVSFRSALIRGKKHEFKRPSIDKSDIAFLQYTGGTTGVSKGAILTHQNIVTNMLQCRTLFGAAFDRGDLIVTPLPLYHVFANTVSLLMGIHMGLPNLLITDPRNIGGFIEELKKYQVTSIFGVNTLFNGMLNHPEFKNLDFSKFKIGIGGGMQVQKVVGDKWKEVTGGPLVEGYGLTECSPVVAANSPEIKDFTGGIGYPLPNTDIEIRDDNGDIMEVESEGELWVRGPQVMQGYWQRPDETDQVIKDGWLATGDVCYIDYDGMLYLVDRKKDVIVSSGFNIYPNEVEEVISAHPKVLEVAVVGATDDVVGETVKAVVVPKDASLDIKELRAFCKKSLTAYKVPRIVEFRSELPKSNVGKVLRRELRD